MFHWILPLVKFDKSLVCLIMLCHAYVHIHPYTKRGFFNMTLGVLLLLCKANNQKRAYVLPVGMKFNWTKNTQETDESFSFVYCRCQSHITAGTVTDNKCTLIGTVNNNFICLRKAFSYVIQLVYYLWLSIRIYIIYSHNYGG